MLHESHFYIQKIAAQALKIVHPEDRDMLKYILQKNHIFASKNNEDIVLELKELIDEVGSFIDKSVKKIGNSHISYRMNSEMADNYSKFLATMDALKLIVDNSSSLTVEIDSLMNFEGAIFDTIEYFLYNDDEHLADLNKCIEELENHSLIQGYNCQMIFKNLLSIKKIHESIILSSNENFMTDDALIEFKHFLKQVSSFNEALLDIETSLMLNGYGENQVRS